MNYLGLDFGLKRIGVAISISGIVQPLAVLQNDKTFLLEIEKIIKDYKIEKIVIGVSEGTVAEKTKKFITIIDKLGLPIETAEEQISTIEATAIWKQNKNPRKDYKKNIDAVSAAVILQRVIL